MYATIEGKVQDGMVIPIEPARMPSAGRALIILLPDQEQKPAWMNCKSELGWLKLDEDPAEWQKHIRGEWNKRA